MNINNGFKKIENNSIVTICDGEIIYWKKRDDAKHFFHNLFMNKPFEEKEKYKKVLFWILIGKDICRDC